VAWECRQGDHRSESRAAIPLGRVTSPAPPPGNGADARCLNPPPRPRPHRGLRSSQACLGCASACPLLPTAADLDIHLEAALAAEAGGLELVGIQDHPYAPRFLDTLSLIGFLLARTSRLRFFPDVANLPLRPPAMLAKAATSLDLLSGGRFELGLGAGGYWGPIERYGGGRRSRSEAVAALEEAIGLIRALWSSSREVEVDGRYYRLHRAAAGPVPAHPIGIWVGALGPSAFRLTGRLGDGWAAPIPSYLPYQDWPGAQEEIDEAARAAARDPAEITRIAQLVGTVTDAPGPPWRAVGAEPIRANASQWASILARLAREQRFDTFIFWPEHQSVDQIRRFAEQVAPHTRELLAAAPPD
jgi:alkanesulfonate monooxygenase SsuD/methylene tetrahydromethanopterin reductase-like flavin-dependent oxidoreductase (luciferase family)